MKRVFARVGFLFLLSLIFTSSSWAQANAVGQWVTLPYQMPIDPVHATLLYNGKVLIIAGSGWVAGNSNYQAAIVDTNAGTVTTQSISWDMFCNGIAILPDGRPFVVSGTLHYDPFEGTVQTATYNPVTGNFTNMQNMAHGRWYPTVTILGDGRAMTFSGLDENGNTNSTVEIYTVGTGWSPPYASPFTPPLYPWLHLLPSGKVFYSGSSPISAIFDPSTNTWTTNVATTNYGGIRTYGTSVLLPLTPANGYKPVVMIMGGSNPSTATTELIDLSVSNPKWVYGPLMAHPRIEMSAVTLPNGKVLTLGGSTNDEDASTAALNAELYDPISNSFSPAGTESFARLYHSTALLLPDATVLVAGSNPVRGTFEKNMEIYSPSYLFTTSNGQIVPATRPTITSLSSSTLGYNAPFQVHTPDAASISSIALMRLGADTHAFNMEQRMVGLSFTAGSGVLNVTTPPNSNIAPPGYYMLFLMNSAGVPSKAAIVQFPTSSGGGVPPTGTILSPTGNVTIGTGQSVNFSGTGNATNGTITGYSWVLPGGNPSSSTLQNPGPVTYSATGSDVASLTVTDSNGLSDPNPPTRTITVVPNFSLSASPATQTVVQGGGTTYTATVTPGTGFTSTVALTVSGLPSGATASFNPGSLKSGASTLSVGTLSNTLAGTYPLTIMGTGGGLSHSSSVNLDVTSSGPPTLVSIAVTPANATLANGATQQFTATGTYSDSSTQNLTSSVTWSSSAPAVATISSTGLATAVGPGSTSIHAVSGAITGSTGLTVPSASSGLVGHWAFDEGTGSAAADSSGSGYNASLFNGVSWVTGKLGDAVSANGSNQYASTPTINLSATGAATVAMWVNRTYTNGADVLFEFSNDYNSNNNTFGFFSDEAADCGNGSMEIALHGNAGYNVKCYVQPTSGVWHHLAVVYDMTQAAASEISLYVDGVLQAAQKQPYSSNNTGSFGSYP
ncbi:MAG: galactose oxidase-like domain-containing protein, partial [Candidatus Acidiferrales bacterium]